MKSTQFQNLRSFCRLSLFTVIPGLIYLIFLDKGDAVIAFNQVHNQVFDIFFKYYTHTGSGWVIVGLAITFLFIRFRLALEIMIIGIFQALTSFLFKGVFFPQAPRPITFFQDTSPLLLVEDVVPLFFRSFPSGHTMTAFGVAAFLASFYQKWPIQLALLTYALLVGVSRMYLGLHFLADVVAGAILGMILTVISLMLTNRAGLFNRQTLDGKLRF